MNEITTEKLRYSDSSSSSSTLTIITPTYNRVHTLSACFNSLARQTCRDYQWIIVDDGSTDGTEELIESFAADGGVPFDYIRKSNGGKHTALNAAHRYIKGKYVTVLDSDDVLAPNAVETIITEWKKYDSNQAVNVLYFYKVTPEGTLFCYVDNPNTVTETYRVRRRSDMHSRDCCDVFRTELFNRYPFPVFDGERFIGEGAAFLNIELAGKGVYIDKAVYICEYLDDGLTKAGRKLRINNPLGGRYNANVYMNKKLPILIRLKNSLLYNCYSSFAGIPMIKSMSESDHLALALIGLIPGKLLYFYWKKKYS